MQKMTMILAAAAALAAAGSVTANAAPRGEHGMPMGGAGAWHGMAPGGWQGMPGAGFRRDQYGMPLAFRRGIAEVPFVGFGGIRDWTAYDDDVLYVEGTGGQWYEVDLAYPCFGLPDALRVGVDSGPTDTLDNFSNVIVDGQRCPVASVTRIAGRPTRDGVKPKG